MKPVQFCTFAAVQDHYGTLCESGMLEKLGLYFYGTLSSSSLRPCPAKSHDAISGPVKDSLERWGWPIAALAGIVNAKSGAYATLHAIGMDSASSVDLPSQLVFFFVFAERFS